MSRVLMSASCLVKHRGHVLRNVTLLLLTVFAPVAGRAAPVKTTQVEAELVAARDTIAAGEPFWIGLRLVHEPSWHTYWINPGGPGYATSVAWELPEGFTAGELQFPYPHRFDGPGGVASYGYDDETILLTKITPPVDLAGNAEITIKGRADWLVCDPMVCVPGNADLTLSLSVDKISSPTSWKPAIDKYLAEVPPDAPGWTLDLEDAGADAIRLRISYPESAVVKSEGLYFFPESGSVIASGKPQAFSVVETGVLEATLAKEDPGAELPESLAGVLYSPVGFGAGPDGAPLKAVRIDTAAEITSSAAAVETARPAAAASSGAPSISLFEAILFGFLGGLILNVMPCVFPVISLKVMSLVNQAGESRGKVFAHGIIFVAGVMISFWALAGILLGFRAAGEQLGWAFQFQSPAFNIVMVILMFALAMSLFGAFEFGVSLTGAGGKLSQASGYAGSFWSGALATLLATPCTGPLLGPIIGFGITQAAAVSLIIFTAIGLGMALPYLVLAIMPNLLRFIPRPGPWMESFKQFMGFPMVAVAIWLLWVLGDQIGNNGVAVFMSGILLLCLGLWIYGRFSAPSRAARTRIVSKSFAALFVLAALFLSVKASRSTPVIAEAKDIAAVIRGHRENGKAVFVDFTAKWCLICQTNKPAMYSESVREKMNALNVAFEVADWTKRDPRITEVLEQYGRAGVPFYPLFPADPNAEPLILPQNLTPGIIIDYLDKLR